MSRICVKNLPKYVVEDRLSDFFSRKGEVTDAKLMRTKDGKSRQFAFIGFRTQQEAQQALKYFNNSYMDTSKITCEIALKVGDPNTPRPWSRHFAKKQQGLVTEEIKKKSGAESRVKSKSGSKKRKEINDPLLEEFLQVTQPRSKSKLWANDTIPVDRNVKAKASENEIQLPPKGDKNQSGTPLNDGVDEDNGIESVKNQKVKKQLAEVLSDMDCFKSRVKKNWSDSEDDEDENGSENSDAHQVDKNDVQTEEHSQEEGKGEDLSEKIEGEVDELGDAPSALHDEKEQLLETGRLFVRNLPYTATEDDLSDLFSKFGNLSEVHVVLDKETKRSKGIAFILYEFPESAVRALEELDNSSFQGRLLHVMPAKQQVSSENPKPTDAAQASKTFKQQRKEQRKATEAGGDTIAWSSFFMRLDTVVENIASMFGVSKSDLLRGDDVAVVVGWGETLVIAETKKALVNFGVNVAALEELASGKTDTTKRSNHVILVKNLPYVSSEGDLANMFGKFGSLDKIILPSTKTLGLVVFLEAAEARAAFEGLAYKRYIDAPLYLEWAPSNILSPTSTSATDLQSNVIAGEQVVKKALLEQHVQGISEMDIDLDRVESRSLFVKNLNFKTSDESLRKHFSDHMKEGSIRSVKVKKHLKNGKSVSMGFGFIEFDSVETATSVCTDLQGIVLDGHALILQLCHAKNDENVKKKVDKDKSTTKLIVRNVAFEATEKDLRQFFSPFGQIKSLRLPMKFGSHRGFAFVEFVTKQEAQNALQALSSTHLYGRHLVLERAKEGESLEELRVRTAAQFTDEQNGFQNPTKLSKKRKYLSIVDHSDVKFERIAG